MDNEYSSFYLYRKYEVTPDGLIPTDDYSVNADGTQEPVMKEECDPECGCPSPEPIYRWVVVSGEFMCSGTTKMTQEKKQISYDSGATWVDVIPSETRPALPVIEYESEDCGYVPPTPTQYRWTPSGYTCIGYDKYQNNIKEQSTDGGTTWTVVIPEEYSASTLIEYNSPDCGYVPFDGKYMLRLNNGNVVTAQCSSTAETITSGEVAQYRDTVVSATLGECVNNIDGAFASCSNLTKIDMPSTITGIGSDSVLSKGAFEFCSGLTSIIIPSGATIIGFSTFYNCFSLTSVTIPNTVTCISQQAFSSCRKLIDVTIPDSVTIIDNYAFNFCYALNSVNIPNSITSINNGVWRYCTGLTSVVIPESVTSIGSAAFENCYSLQTIIIHAVNPPSLGKMGNRLPFDGSTCPIQVPFGSVDAYKTATNWSVYASRIQTISNT